MIILKRYILLISIFVLILLLIVYTTENNVQFKEQFDIQYKIVDREILLSWLKEEIPQGKWYRFALETLGNEMGIQRLDYENETYLVITSGEKPSGGYEIKLRSIINKDNEIIVIAEDVPPPPSTPVPDIMDNPSLLFYIDKIDKEITLKWIE